MGALEVRRSEVAVEVQAEEDEAEEEKGMMVAMVSCCLYTILRTGFYPVGVSAGLPILSCLSKSVDRKLPSLDDSGARVGIEPNISHIPESVLMPS
jgi:hypothetical protein